MVYGDIANGPTNKFLMSSKAKLIAALAGACISSTAGWAAVNVMLTEVPDYSWQYGCFGTASGNLMGYWDRHGLPNLYTGPTAGGVAPLNDAGSNVGIRSMWASKAGFDGRPLNQPGHIDDYYVAYESTANDPYVTAQRAEHTPDCIGDFIGLNQKKWKSLNSECDGNIDGYSFVYWDHAGAKRANYVPPIQDPAPVPDIPSGLRSWTKYHRYGADVFSQLTDFNPNVPAGTGFTFADLKAEIDAGYPVLLFLQPTNQFNRSLPNMPRANPIIHGMLAYGYYINNSGVNYVRYKTSWASGDTMLSQWAAANWQAELPLRGVIGFHPLPKFTSITHTNDAWNFKWDGPSSILKDLVTLTTTNLHWYVLEKSTTPETDQFVAITEPTSNREITITNCCDDAAFFRVKLLEK